MLLWYYDIMLHIMISKLFIRYLDDTDIADIYLAENRYRYADTDVQFADTDI